MWKTDKKNCYFEYESSSDILQFTDSKGWVELDGRQVENCAKMKEKPDFLFWEDLEVWQSFLKNREGNECDLRLLSQEGKIHWCHLQANPVVYQDGSYKLLGSIFDIDHQFREREQEKFFKSLDPLTEVYDTENVELEVDRYLENKGHDRKHAMLILDIANMENVKLNLGFLFGSAVLSNLSRELKNCLPANAIIGRVGSAAFVILLKNILNEDEILEATEQIKEAIREIYIGEKKELSIGCCMGIALYPGHGTNYQSLFEKADEALYEAKESGKNRVQVYTQTILGLLPDKKGKYYNDYEIQDSEGFSSTRGRELKRFAFDLLAKTKDVGSAVNLLLERIGKEYQVSSVSVIETEKKHRYLRMAYEWHNREVEKAPVAFEIDEKKLLLNECFDSRGLYHTSNSPHSALVSAFYEEGKFRGCIYLRDTQTERNWTEEEKEDMVEIARILSVYLLKLRVSEQVSQQLEQIASYDSLTRLPTLKKLKQNMAEILREHPQRYAVIYWDILNFKFINEMYGVHAGDRVLCDLSEFLKHNLNTENCLLARKSSDKFIGFCPAGEKEALRDWIRRLNVEFHRQQNEKNHLMNLRVVSGIYIMEKGDMDISLSLDRANIARKAAKTEVSEACKFYDEKMEEAIRRELEILNIMEDALENQEFVVYYQPKMGLNEEDTTGAEALVRWRRPDGRLISPGEFVPLFERNGFIVQVDFFVYDEVCRTLHRWLDEGRKVVPVSVNVSRVHLNDDNFVDKLKELVDSYHIPRELLELELTESLFLDNTKTTLATMQRLRELGFHVSIDDFGSGYSSLSLLKDMATDVIKLDKEFFANGEMQKEEKIVVSNIINMAKQLNMKVLSEGIETKDQMDFLKEINCDMVQGYYYAKPMPLQEFEQFLKK
jgi:diguanylate cyclase (GGDEF)-like protein